jgi:dTDP-4-dehydrorhamnose reductase
VSPNCLLFGANGQMGKACRSVLADLDFKLVPLSKSDCDITDHDALSNAFATHRPTLAINAAAFTNVDACETAQTRARAINSVAPQNIARLCSHHDVTLIHLSTDYVFGDYGSPPLNEEAATGPINCYGQSKLDGEIAIRNEMDRYIILRTSWIFSVDSNNFFRTIMSLSERLDRISVVNDEASCPTFADELAHAMGIVAKRSLERYSELGTLAAARALTD